MSGFPEIENPAHLAVQATGLLVPAWEVL